MTDSGMGINPIWAVAIVLLFFLFERRGFGDMFGGGHPAIFNAGGWGNNDCVTNKNVLETLFATSTANSKQLDAISQAQTANWINLKTDIADMQTNTLRDQLQDAKNENLYLRGKIEADARYNSLQAQIAAISCTLGNMPQNPKFIPAGGFECFVPYNSCCPTTTTAK